MSKLTKIIEQHKRSQKARSYSRFYNLNSMLGNDWAMFFVIIGSRMTGKSYSVTDFLCRQKKTKANWDDPDMLSKAEFELVYDTYTLDSNLTDLQNRNAVISDIIQQQKWGYGNKEKEARKLFYEEN